MTQHQQTLTNSQISHVQIPHVGIDIGSTTTKVVVVEPGSTSALYSEYRRHCGMQAQSVHDALLRVQERFGDTIRVAFSGSGAAPIAERLDAPFIQEVVANAQTLRQFYPETRCAIELGGQDAKMIFFRRNNTTGQLEVSDMRMNGSCAGGTGAFIDEVASLLKVPIEEFDSLASQGSTVYEISGRCGVYAKTDIQPLLNQGVAKSDLALSACHAIAKQTIGGLAQGLTIEAPVVFEGGPLTFNPTLVRVFCERLDLSEPSHIIIPDSPETVVALGAALSLSDMFAEDERVLNVPEAIELLASTPATSLGEGAAGSSVGEAGTLARPLFANEEERRDFERRHANDIQGITELDAKISHVRAYLGIDSGSTTTKFALLTEDGQLIDAFYANNTGQPLDVARTALLELRDRWQKSGKKLEILGCGTCGYGELLFNTAFHADYHTVETVAHVEATRRYVPDASFVLDIGGQDMKAIWLDDGVISDIVVNEACSSGCGSFLENFAATLNIPTTQIAASAFRSTAPAELGSRCTVFMNSSIITEQRNGKTPDDIMAGLCRSIVANVFTKVIRMSNLDSLGNRIVVQGGTFNNDAVLHALEEYLGKHVQRAPYPGLMGAIGVALLTQRYMRQKAQKQAGEQAHDVQGESSREELPQSSFIGLDALEDFSYTQESGLICPFCANHCNRTLVSFADGSSFVTGNRCPKGEVIGNLQDEAVREKLRAVSKQLSQVPNMFEIREKLLFEKRKPQALCEPRNITIGIARALATWDTFAFWDVFWQSLGFTVKLSRPSSRDMYERGLPSVASDTICFPAKLVHGHVLDLMDDNVDRIFMPIITAVPTENIQSTSKWMCAVVKGYPMVVRTSDNPDETSNISLDTPLFHWYELEDRDAQLTRYMQDTFGISPELTAQAIQAGDAAQKDFQERLVAEGTRIIEQVEQDGGYAVVLAGRPYHNDPLVNHDIPRLFCEMGIPVLSCDALPATNEVDLSASRLDIVNNFHARMLSSALIAARSPHLEYAQIVSFGCGHDAYLSDEIVRLMRETSDSVPLILKVDESDIQGPLRIRVRSFVETLAMRRSAHASPVPQELPDPYPVKFTKEDKKRVLLIPNVSHAFAELLSAAMSCQGIHCVPLDIGRGKAIRMGKQYVHNDICFPAQVSIGEALAELDSGKYDNAEVAVATSKYIGDCRLTHYTPLLRKALDDAGYADVPIIDTDNVDAHNIHPGFKLGIRASLKVVLGLPMIDALEGLLRKIRPYELEEGATQAAFDKAMAVLIRAVSRSGIIGITQAFRKSIDIMCEVRYDRTQLRPTVLIVGELLLNFHPGANHDIELYLEKNGFEIIEAKLTDVIRKTYFYKHAQDTEYHVSLPAAERAWNAMADNLFEFSHNIADRIARRHPLYEPPTRLPELVKASDPIIHHTFDAGEGVLISAEIIECAKQGCRDFIILGPFGCLPNHVVGRGIVGQLRKRYPDARFLALDYDPDVSQANIENRLQMLVMNAKEAARQHTKE